MFLFQNGDLYDFKHKLRINRATVISTKGNLYFLIVEMKITTVEKSDVIDEYNYNVIKRDLSNQTIPYY